MPKRSSTGKIRVHEPCDTILDLQGIYPKFDTKIAGSRYVQIKPFNSLPKLLSSTLDFYIDHSLTEYVYLPTTYLSLKLRGVKKKGDGDFEPFGDGEKEDKSVAVTPLIGQTIIKKLSLEINNQEVTDTLTNKYAYEAYVKTLLEYSSEQQEKYLEGARPKILEGLDVTSPQFDLNFHHRNISLRDGFKVFSPFLHGFFRCKKLIPPGLPMKLSLSLNSRDFCIINNNDPPKDITFDIEILEASLYVQRITLSPGEQLHQERRLRAAGANYPFNYYDIGSHVINPGSLQPIIPILKKSNRLPQMLHCVLQPKEELGPGWNPFNFQFPKALKDIYLTVNGERLPYQIGYDRDEMERNYELLKLQQNYSRGVNQMTKHLWGGNRLGGKTIFSFSLLGWPESKGCPTVYVREEQNAIMYLNLIFDRALDDHWVVTWFMECPTVMHVDSNRRITFEDHPIK